MVIQMYVFFVIKPMVELISFQLKESFFQTKQYIYKLILNKHSQLINDILVLVIHIKPCLLWLSDLS